MPRRRSTGRSARSRTTSWKSMKLAARISSMRRTREAVQVVLGGLRLDVPGLVRQMRACGMDALALAPRAPGHRVLGEPVDLQVGVQPAQLAGDRDVALGVAEPDRRGDKQRARAAVRAVNSGVARRALPSEHILGEVAQRQVDLDRLARVGKWPAPGTISSRPSLRRASERPSRGGVILSRSPGITSTGQSRFRASSRSRRAGEGDAEFASSRATSVSGSVSSAHPTPVLDRLGRVRLGEAAGEEPFRRTPGGPCANDLHLCVPTTGEKVSAQEQSERASP